MHTMYPMEKGRAQYEQKKIAKGTKGSTYMICLLYVGKHLSFQGGDKYTGHINRISGRRKKAMK